MDPRLAERYLNLTQRKHCHFELSSTALSVSSADWRLWVESTYSLAVTAWLQSAAGIGHLERRFCSGRGCS